MLTSYHISCNGTLVSINARGFCGKTNQIVALLLYVAQFQNETLVSSTPYFRQAVCDTSTTISLHRLEYHKGTISVENENIQISAGNHLGIRFDTNCSDLGCLFQPAIVNESSKHTLYFLDDSFAMEQQTNTSLLFSATIISGMSSKIICNCIILTVIMYHVAVVCLYSVYISQVPYHVHVIVTDAENETETETENDGIVVPILIAALLCMIVTA